MSSSYTDSNSDSYTEVDIKAVLGQIYDDFHAIASRGFDFINDHPNYLESLREDLFFIMKKKDLVLFQFQFKNDGKVQAIEYEIKPDGSVHENSDSGGIDYWEFKRSSKINTVVRLKGDPKVWEELERRGWRKNGQIIDGEIETVGSYASGNLGAIKKIIR